MALTTEQILESIDRLRADAERQAQALRDLRDAIAGAPAGELTEDEEREIADLATERAARMRKARAR